MTETVSVIIPFFNDSATLRRALDSVLEQSEPPCEVIVSDDGSGPSELEALKSIVESGQSGTGVPVRVIHSTSNRGPASARNAGWDRATGSWVAFLDADDSWVGDKVARQLEVARRRPGVALMSSLARQESGDVSTVTMTQDAPCGRVRVSQAGSLRMLFGNPLITSGVMVRRDIPLRFDERMRFAEDYDLWVRVVRSTGAAAVLKDSHVISYKRSFGDSGLSASLVQMQLGALRVILRAALPPSLISLAVPSAIAYSSLRFVRRICLTLWAKGASARTSR